MQKLWSKVRKKVFRLRESFTINTELKDYESDVDELNFYHVRQRFALFLVLFGGILILGAFL